MHFLVLRWGWGRTTRPCCEADYLQALPPYLYAHVSLHFRLLAASASIAYTITPAHARVITGTAISLYVHRFVSLHTIATISTIGTTKLAARVNRYSITTSRPLCGHEWGKKGNSTDSTPRARGASRTRRHPLSNSPPRHSQNTI